jgi:ABC-type transporter Mla maintaining outer membrane lipid asymmetry permease subunit MlaE
MSLVGIKVPHLQTQLATPLNGSAIVALVSCHKGYFASGGARGVGKAVTLAAVYTNLYIVLANFITSQLLTALEVLLKGHA